MNFQMSTPFPQDLSHRSDCGENPKSSKRQTSSWAGSSSSSTQPDSLPKALAMCRGLLFSPRDFHEQSPSSSSPTPHKNLILGSSRVS